MSQLSQNVVELCREKLIAMKMDLLNRARSLKTEMAENNTQSGDEIDQVVAHSFEHQFLVGQERIRHQLMEIESALARIESGHFGICEETEEMIEADRLLAIPYTRLSIEGAEIREASSKKFAR